MTHQAGVHIVSHPLLAQHLTKLRAKETLAREFRWSLKESAKILLLDALAQAPMKKIPIETPLARTEGQMLAIPIVLVAVLRAGLGMIEGMTEILSEASLGHIGLYRDERTLRPVHYYSKIPPIAPNAWTIIVDPMLATGGSATYAINLLRERGARTVKQISLIASKRGIQNLRKAHPDIEIFVAQVDKVLNNKGYIVPGLGDCGDRLFSTA
ncbi:MAG: uracil phosphoribosyltransferase [Elusimicrobia bacterium]|nr:uracil phosphoribosyltransferase [Elusimicrobiota bacterium]